MNEHTTTVYESGEHRVLLAQGWSELAVYADPRFNCPRALMAREVRSTHASQRVALVTCCGREYTS